MSQDDVKVLKTRVCRQRQEINLLLTRNQTLQETKCSLEQTIERQQKIIEQQKEATKLCFPRTRFGFAPFFHAFLQREAKNEPPTEDSSEPFQARKRYCWYVCTRKTDCRTHACNTFLPDNLSFAMVLEEETEDVLNLAVSRSEKQATYKVYDQLYQVDLESFLQTNVKTSRVRRLWRALERDFTWELTLHRFTLVLSTQSLWSLFYPLHTLDHLSSQQQKENDDFKAWVARLKGRAEVDGYTLGGLYAIRNPKLLVRYLFKQTELEANNLTEWMGFHCPTSGKMEDLLGILEHGVDPRLNTSDKRSLYLGAGAYFANSPDILKDFGHSMMGSPKLSFDEFEDSLMKMTMKAAPKEEKTPEKTPLSILSHNLLPRPRVSGFYDQVKQTWVTKPEWQSPLLTCIISHVLPGRCKYYPTPTVTSRSLRRPPSGFDSTACFESLNQLRYVATYDVAQACPVALCVYFKQ